MMNFRSITAAPHFRLFATLLAGAASSVPASAVDYTWTGTTNNTWGTAANWGGTAPVSASSSAVFFGTATNRSPNVAATTTIGSITFNSGADAFTISRSNGTFTLSGGGVTNNSSNLQLISANTALSGATTWNTASADLTASGVLSGSGASVTKTGSGTLTFSGANTYSGTTTISTGTLQVGSAGTAGALGTGAVTDNSILSFNRTNAFTVGNAISGTGTVKQIGTGATTLTGTNTYTGGTLISFGTLQVGTNGSLGSGGVTNNSVLGYSGTGTVTEANIISGTGSLSQSGTGTTILTATNTYTGGTTISGGALQFSSSGNLSTGTITLNGGALRWAPGSTVDVFDRVSLGTNGGALDTNGNDITLATALGGSGVLTKAGAGVLTVSVANPAFTGVGVTGGTFRVGSATAIPANVPITVNGTTTGGTAIFDLNGNDFTSGNLTFGGSTGKANVVNTLATGSGTLTLGGASTVTYTSTGNPGTAVLTGKLDLGSAAHLVTIGNSSNTDTELSISADISGTGGLTKAGTGTLALTGTNNTYSGITTITAGALRISSASNLSNASNVQLNGGVLELAADVAIPTGTGAGQVQWIGSGGFSAGGANRTVTLAGGAGLVWGNPGFVPGGSSLILSAASSNSTITVSNDIDLNGAARTVSVTNGTAAIDAALSGVLSNGTLTVAGTGVLALTGLNTFTGPITLPSNVTLAVTQVANGGFASSLGASSNAASNLLITNGTLQYVGTGGSTDRLLQIGAGSNTYATLVANGVADSTHDGALVFSNTGSIGYAGSTNQDRSLALEGSNTAYNTFTPQISNNGTGAVSVRKDDGGKWVLAGANTYTGLTYIAAGTVGVSNALSLGGYDFTSYTTVQDGATLELINTDLNNPLLVPERVIITGLGVGGLGALISNTTGVSRFTAGRVDFQGTASIGGTGLLEINSQLSYTYSSDVIIKTGSGTLTLGGVIANDLRTTIVQAGNLVLDKRLGGSPGAYQWAISGSNLTINTGGKVQIAGNTGDQIGYMTTVQVDAGGMLDFNGRNEAFNGLTGTGTVTNTSATASVMQIGSYSSYEDLGTSSSFSGVIQDGVGRMALTKAGTGTFTLNSANTYSGITTVGQGTLVVANAAALGNTSGYTSVNSGATLNISNTALNAEIIYLNGTGVSNVGALTSTGTSSLAGYVILNTNSTVGVTGSLAINGNVSGGGTLTKIGTGTLTLAGSNTYSGGTTIMTGTVQVGAGGSTGNLGTGGVTNNGSLIYNRTDTLTESNVISGGGTLTQAGTGKLILSGTHSYTGATTVNSGTLQIDGSIATSATTVNTGGKLQGQGTLGAVTMNAGSTLMAGDSATLRNLTIGSLLFNAGATLQFKLDSSVLQSDLITLSGQLTLNNTELVLTDLASLPTALAEGTSLTLVSYNYGMGDGLGTGTDIFRYNGQSLTEGSTFTAGLNTFQINYSVGDPTITLTAVVPEPGTWIMLVSGLGLLAFVYKRKMLA